jgi:alkanesulfonate monooxygenase SsuD/methylene tetrahydromethanopterin reductase-like flavin-dependent oxidoreductase (luciferase family)
MTVSTPKDTFDGTWEERRNGKRGELTVKYGILGPYMSGTDRATLLEWFRRVDRGPFATIATGERELWSQIEQHAFLAAAATATERVKVMSHIMIVPMHPPVLLAKRLASIDVISGGRLIVGVGTGGRSEDYQAAGSSFQNRWQKLDEAVEVMQRVWAGGPPWEEASAPVGPLPAQPGGPPFFTSASGVKALARAARWADGWQGAIMTVDPETLRVQVEQHLAAWESAGRTQRPYLMNSLWYALGADGEKRLADAASNYFGLPPRSRTPVGTIPASSPDGVKMAIDNCEAAGFDELMFIPITDDLNQLDELERALEGR